LGLVSTCAVHVTMQSSSSDSGTSENTILSQSSGRIRKSPSL
jgi:hypothetical protein